MAQSDRQLQIEYTRQGDMQIDDVSEDNDDVQLRVADHMMEVAALEETQLAILDNMEWQESFNDYDEREEEDEQAYWNRVYGVNQPNPYEEAMLQQQEDAAEAHELILAEEELHNAMVELAIWAGWVESEEDEEANQVMAMIADTLEEIASSDNIVDMAAVDIEELVEAEEGEIVEMEEGEIIE